MNKTRKIAAALGAVAATAALLTGCTSDADTVSRNISTDSEQFKVQRRIVIFNGITDKVLLQIEGKCSVEKADSSLGEGTFEVTCRLGPNEYKKYYAGLSDNVSFFVDQLQPIDESVYHTKVLIKPENVIPDFDLQTGKQ